MGKENRFSSIIKGVLRNPLRHSPDERKVSPTDPFMNVVEGRVSQVVEESVRKGDIDEATDMLRWGVNSTITTSEAEGIIFRNAKK